MGRPGGTAPLAGGAGFERLSRPRASPRCPWPPRRGSGLPCCPRAGPDHPVPGVPRGTQYPGAGARDQPIAGPRPSSESDAIPRGALGGLLPRTSPFASRNGDEAREKHVQHRGPRAGPGRAEPCARPHPKKPGSEAACASSIPGEEEAGRQGRAPDGGELRLSLRRVMRGQRPVFRFIYFTEGIRDCTLVPFCALPDRGPPGWPSRGGIEQAGSRRPLGMRPPPLVRFPPRERSWP